MLTLNPAYAIQKGDEFLGKLYMTIPRVYLFLHYVFLLLIRDVRSRAASMEVLVCLTRKRKLSHVRVHYLGLDTDMNLNWVMIT